MTAILASCGNALFKTYSFSEDPIPYGKVGYETTITMDSITNRAYRDKALVDTLIFIQSSPHVSYKFKLNQEYFYSFMGNGSDSGPIYWQYKGKYDLKSDSVIINFTELISIGYNAKYFSNMKIEDREWRKLEYLPSKTFIVGKKRDTIWATENSGFKGSYLIKQ
jgi:hypothetical protein